MDIPAEIARREARLAAISEARQRLEQRQRDADLERGRDPDEPPRGGRYKREFGVPEDKAPDNFTDPDSRIMKRAGGGFDASYNAQTAVDGTAHIIVAAELTNNASDAGELPTMLNAVKTTWVRCPHTSSAWPAHRHQQGPHPKPGRGQSCPQPTDTCPDAHESPRREPYRHQSKSLNTSSSRRLVKLDRLGCAASIQTRIGVLLRALSSPFGATSPPCVTFRFARPPLNPANAHRSSPRSGRNRRPWDLSTDHVHVHIHL